MIYRWDLSPKYRGKGRPRVKGAKLPTPCQVVAHSRLRNITVDWYGSTQWRVEISDGAGFWYKSGHGLVPSRWVFVCNQTGTHRDEYF